MSGRMLVMVERGCLSPKPTSSKHGLEGKKTGKHHSAKATGRVGDVVLA
jgi:hypothetical protein